MPAIELPYTLKGKALAIAAEVMGNFNALRSALEGVSSAASGADVYQKGVVASGDWFPEAGGAIGAGTGIVSEKFGGAAWLPGPSGALVRTFTPPALYPMKPPVLPGPGGYICVGFELTASGSSAAVSVVSGAEQGSLAAAAAAPPAVSAGKMRILDVVVRNNAGVYEAPSGRDRRPWARGAFVRQLRTTNANATVNSTVMTPIDTATLQARIECSGAPLRLTLTGTAEHVSGEANHVYLGFWMDGAVPEAALTNISDIVTSSSATGTALASLVLTPAAGSHLFTPVIRSNVGEAAILGTENRPAMFVVEELVRQNANNGTT